LLPGTDVASELTSRAKSVDAKVSGTSGTENCCSTVLPESSCTAGLTKETPATNSTRRYRPDTFASTLFARDVSSEATPVPGSKQPAYPPGLAEQGVRALVSTMFVVNEAGVPDLATFRVLNTADEKFVDAIRSVLGHTRFVPAQKDGASVRQVVQYTYDFGLVGDPARGDILVRPAVAAVPHADGKAPVKTMYIVSADELSAPDIEQMNLAEALHRLRPRLYGTPRSRSNTTPDEAPVFVNGVRVEGMASLRAITAGHVEEVRYWKREEAAMQFGMEYPYAVTVKMRPDRS
jgi:hypothetical protein